MSLYAIPVPEGTLWDSTTNQPKSIDPNYVWNPTTQKLEPATTLGNGLTNSKKWAWVIGLTFAAWALLYWSEKK
jgi:hypothetical protein